MTKHGDIMARIKTLNGEVSMKMNMPKLHNSYWKRKISLVLIFTMILSVFMNQGWLSPQSASAITYSSSGALVYGTTPLATAYPSGIVANDLLVLVVGMKPTTINNGTVTTPTGWTALTLIRSTTGTQGGDTGGTNLFTFYRVAAGTETGTLSVTTASANVAWAQMYRFTDNTAWSVANATGTDTTTGAAVSITFSSDPGVQQGDYILGAMCIPTDVTTPAQFSAQAFSQTGITFGTVTEISEPDSSTGNDIGGFVVQAPVASGTATGSPTMTATAGGTTTNVQGPGVFVRIRETDPPAAGMVTLSPDDGVYTSASPTITTTFIEYSSDISGCEYTTNGTTWSAGTLSGSRPAYTCTAKPSGLSGSLTINMRATSGDGTGSGGALTRTADGTGPTDGALTVTPGADQNALSWTAATDGVSGLRTTNTYDVRMVAGAALPANCSAGTSIYMGTGTSYTHAKLTAVAGGYSYRVCAYDKVNNASTGATGSGLPTWTSTITSCGRCHGDTTIFTDATTSTSRGTPDGAFVGDHDAHAVKLGTACSVCHVVPGVTDYAHRDGNIQMQGTIAGGSYSKVSPFVQTNTPTTGTCSNISCHGANNPTPQWGVGTAGCVDCHAGSITRTMAAGTLDNVVAEFGLAWGHKKTGRGGVTNADCIVCHLEGDYLTQKTAAKHMDGNIDLRDPDGSGETAITNISGGTFTFTKFSTSYAAGSRTTTGHTSNNIDNVITQKFCLACHDSNGATNTTARTSGGTAFMPWGGVDLGPNYTVANGAAVAGGVIDTKSQFATTNSSKHPIMGPRSAGYPTTNRLAAPYNNFTRTAGTLANSVVLNCFDCHTTGASLVNRTIVAHGNAATVRGTVRVSGTPSSTNYPTLCRACHVGYETTSSADAHDGTAYPNSSAFGAGTQYDTGMDPYPAYGCWVCHTNEVGATVNRPIEAQNVHGYPASLAGGTTYKVAFIRGSQSITGHEPASIGGTARASNCTGMGGSYGNCTSARTEVYSPGGVY
ncbi:MAG: CxxxxCH/CxxCH domain c-type cytochrome [Nitrospirota bacterium]